MTFFLLSDMVFSAKCHFYISHTLSVRIPQSNALESVSNKASTLRAAIRRQASETVVLSGTVKAFDSLNLLTVRSPVSPLLPDTRRT